MTNTELTLLDKQILAEFESLPKGFWDFKEAKTDIMVHTLHPYPAVMIYPISKTIIEIISKHKDINCLFDPFSGSGTVIVEGQLHNIEKVIANDLNPLANLITEAKTKILNNIDFETIYKIRDKIDYLGDKYRDLVASFADFVLNNYSIVEKGEWSSNAGEITNKFFEGKIKDYKIFIPSITNLGFWFRPETIMPIFLIKEVIDNLTTKNAKSFLYCSLSETIRFVSNTRNGEFKLYRMTEKSITSKYFDVFKEFLRVLDKNISKEEEYKKNLPSSLMSNVEYHVEDCRVLSGIKDSSVDLVITSPPYGDSHTTVAYGQFSRLSNDLLGLSEITNIDSILLGGKKIKNRSLEYLASKTLTSIYNEISKVDVKRANEVLDFYYDLDDSIKAIADKTKKEGYQFWVVGNRTVKKVHIPTDVIIEELGLKYGLIPMTRFYRVISNKVMPSLNSPTNISGQTISTMCDETILVLKKAQ